MEASQRLLWPAVLIGLLGGFVLGVLVTSALKGGSGGPTDQVEEDSPPEEGGPPPASVRVGVAQLQTLQHRVPVIGRLEEVRRVTVTAEVEGKVIDLAVDEGDAVRGDQSTLAQIDQVWAKLRHESAVADVAAAQAQLDQAQSDLNQLERLRENGSAKLKEVEDARTLVSLNQARLAAAVAAGEQAQTEMQRTTVTAPFDGAVSRTLVEVGQWVEPGDGVVEMISSGAIDAVIDVPERFVNGLAIGEAVEVVVDVHNTPVVGRIVSVRPDGTSASRTYPVKVRLPNDDGKLRAGMSVTANVPVSREGEFITVPRDAVLFNAAGATVWVAQPMGGPLPAALPEPVDLLFGIDERYAVAPLPGGAMPLLAPGKPVVIEGAERLFPTQPLDIANPVASDTAPEPGPPSAEDSPAPPDPTPTGAGA